MSCDRIQYSSRQFIADGRTLDPERPEFLIYYDNERGKKLIGFTFLVSSPGERRPQVGEPTTVCDYLIGGASADFSAPVTGLRPRGRQEMAQLRDRRNAGPCPQHRALAVGDHR